MMVYTKDNPWRDSDGTASYCIGCKFNTEEEWPGSMFDNLKISRENHFPKENYICKNPNSKMFNCCIIGHTGCEETSI